VAERRGVINHSVYRAVSVWGTSRGRLRSGEEALMRSKNLRRCDVAVSIQALEIPWRWTTAATPGSKGEVRHGLFQSAPARRRMTPFT
jgi:hypothetical protein